MTYTIDDLKSALEQYETQQCEELDQKYGNLPEHKFSHRFERRMRSLIRKYSMTPQQRRTIDITKKAAAVIGIVILAVGITIVSVDAFREPFIRVIFFGGEKPADYEFSMSFEEYFDVDLTQTMYVYIPDGYVKSEETYNPDKTISRLRFENDVGATFTINLKVITPDNESNTWARADAEISGMTEMKINREAALLSYKDSEYTLIWWQRNVLCRIAGNISKQEIIRIAEGIEICFLE